MGPVAVLAAGAVAAATGEADVVAAAETAPASAAAAARRQGTVAPGSTYDCEPSDRGPADSQVREGLWNWPVAAGTGN